MSLISAPSKRQTVLVSLRDRKDKLENEKAWYKYNGRKDEKIPLIQKVITHAEITPKAEHLDLTSTLTPVEKETLFSGYLGYFSHETKDLFERCQNELNEGNLFLSNKFSETLIISFSESFLNLHEFSIFSSLCKKFNVLLNENLKIRVLKLSSQISPYLKQELVHDTKGLDNGKARLIAFNSNISNHLNNDRLLSLKDTKEDIIFLENYIDCRGNFEKYPDVLINAAQSGQVEIVRILIHANANLNATSNAKKNNIVYGCTALMLAAQSGQVEIVRILIHANANLNATSNAIFPMNFRQYGQEMISYGYTALMLAAHNGHVEIVRLLIQANANLNAKTTGGYTALILAAMKNHVEIVRLLIQANPNLKVEKNIKGETAYNLVLCEDKDSKVAPEIYRLLKPDYL